MIKDIFKVFDKLSMGVGKKMEDHAGCISNVKLELFDGFGKSKDVREVHNLVTTLGKYCAAAQMLVTPVIVKPGWMELGLSSGGAVGDSILKSYKSGSRTALDSKTRTNAIVTMICTFPADVGTGAITEAGVFNVATENTTDLILYADFAVINKLAADSLVVTWTLQFS